MKLLSIVSLLSSVILSNAENFAVIVAGSNTYGNYRHQADACNAIKLLKQNGMPEANIISLLYDDIANNPSNPFPGQIFNKPTDAGVPGADVYAECSITYKSVDVTPETFTAVMTGDTTYVPKSGKAGPVLKTTAEDKVFVFFSDHGATGLIAFPSSYLYSDALMTIFTTMHSKNMYKELVFYLEACESGSMFAKLPTDINVYATSASNAAESSWGTYCSPQDMVNGKHVGSCLGDLYSVNWMEDVYANNVKTETLLEDYNTVKAKTTLSEVCQFGTLPIDVEVLSNFMAGSASFRKEKEAPSTLDLDYIKATSSVDSRDNQLHYLTAKYLNAVGEQKQIAAVELQNEIAHRETMDSIFTSTTTSVLGASKVVGLATMEVIPESFSCLRKVNDVVDSTCGRYSDYSLKYVKNVVYMCEEKVSAGMTEEAAADVISAVLASECKKALYKAPVKAQF